MRARRTGISFGAGVVAVLAIDERDHAAALRRLNVHEEHVRRILAHLQREVAQQVRL